MIMPALLIVTDPDVKLLQSIERSFTDYTLVTLTSREREKYYQEVKRALKYVDKSNGKVFLIANGNPAFNALLAAKLVLKCRFLLGELINKEFKMLHVP